MDTEAENNSPAGEDNYLSFRKQAIRADLERRLRNICAHLSDAEFGRLIDVMAERQLKGERRRIFD